jgi:hypothetical protein
MRTLVLMNESASTTYKLTDTRRPLAPEMQVGAARGEYLAENGFKIAEYTAPTFKLKVFGHYVDAPNSTDRQWAIPLHDLHHVATGYGTDFVGEAEIGLWELRAGCRTWVVYYLNAAAACIGLVLAPRRMLAAWRASKGARSLYRHPIPMEKALSMSVGELRAHLGIPEGGLGGERHLHEDAELARRRQVAGAAQAVARA